MLKITELDRFFPTEDACKNFLVKHRWPKGVTCPRCGSAKVYKLSHRAWHWQCHQCAKKGYRFSVISGTVFENTKYPLKTWFTVALLMLHSKKGMSAHQIWRSVFHDTSSYRTVWYMCQRIRAAMNNDEFRDLMGIVEVDETFIGGKAKNAHRGNRGKKHRPTGGNAGGSMVPPKTAVIGAIARKGNVVCRVIEETDRATLQGFVQATVSDQVKLVATDQHPGYDRLNRLGFPHESVNHARGEYVRGNVHTANLDSFWSLLKRGIIGTYHQVGKKYLPLYLAEFSFRHNHRKDADMFGALIAGC